MESTTRNEVRLVGRLAAQAQSRTLPSGDEITTFRLVVDRPPARSPRSGRQITCDTLDCVTWTAAGRRAAAGFAAGDVLEVNGALRRRFWRTALGVGSRYEVEVERLKRVAKAPRTAA